MSSQVPTELLKVVRAVVLLSPNIPLLFMGEEYGETAPFQYFIEHGDPALIEAVRQGRRREFAHFGWRAEDIPDPQGMATFERSRVNWEQHTDGQERLLRWTHELIRLRKTVPSLRAGDGNVLRHAVWVFEQEQVVVLHRWHELGDGSLVILGFNRKPETIMLAAPVGRWRRRLDVKSAEFEGKKDGMLPEELVIDSRGLSLNVTPYTVALYMTREQGRSV